MNTALRNNHESIINFMINTLNASFNLYGNILVRECEAKDLNKLIRNPAEDKGLTR